MRETKDRVRLLLVDDEADFRQAIARGLSRRGFEVEVAADGVAGIAAIRKKLPDIVLLDQKMPGMSGIDTLKEMRKISEDLPVIVLTGHGDFDTALAGIRLEIVDFIHKPVDVDRLSRRIHALLARDVNELMQEPTVSDLMVPPDVYPTVYVDDLLTSALKVISDAYRKPISKESRYGQVRSALVYNRRDEFQGMIRFSDLLELLIPEGLRDSPYASYFTGMFLAQSKVFGKKTIENLIWKQATIDVSTPLMEAVNVLVEKRLINVPVVNNGKLVGILRGRDIIIATARLAGVEL